MFRVEGFIPLRFTVGTGSSGAVLVDLSQYPGFQAGTIRYYGGGTLFILGVTNTISGGFTLGATDVANGLTTSAYPVEDGDRISFDGAPRFYFAATGATTFAAVLGGKSAST